MKKLLCTLGIILSALVIGSSITFARGLPSPVGYVNDFAAVLDSHVRFDLEARLVQLEKDTNAEVAVVTINSLEGEDINFFANDIFAAWGIGKSDKDNGVLFLIAVNDHLTRIEVGYGLESIITDSRAGRILDIEVIPSFKKGDFNNGITNGVIAIEKLVREGTPPSVIEDNFLNNFVRGSDFWLPLLIGLGVITIYLMGWMARTRSIWLGGIWGIVVGVLLGFALGRLGFVIGLPIGLGIFGTILDIILSRNYRSRSSSGQSTSWRSTWGGFSGPTGGFSSGGGFGGFGGGHSGGGGAGRGW